MRNKTKLLFSFTALILSVVLFAGAIFAWFSFDRKSNEQFILAGDIDLNCEVYVAIDEDFDGIPDIPDDLPTNPLRSDILENYYRTLKDAKALNAANHQGSETFQNVYIGRKQHYKIVVINNSASKAAAKISISFSKMSDYFSKCVDMYLKDYGIAKEEDKTYKERDYVNYFASNSSRLLFNVVDIESCVYEGEKFNTPGTPHKDSNSYPLWKLSHAESMIENVVLEYGKLLEIDYVFSCNFHVNDINAYNMDAVSLYNYLIPKSADSVETKKFQEAISSIADAESRYVFDDSQSGEGGIGDGNKLEFTIGKIIIRGIQINL